MLIRVGWIVKHRERLVGGETTVYVLTGTATINIWEGKLANSFHLHIKLNNLMNDVCRVSHELSPTSCMLIPPKSQ